MLKKCLAPVFALAISFQLCAMESLPVATVAVETKSVDVQPVAQDLTVATENQEAISKSVDLQPTTEELKVAQNIVDLAVKAKEAGMSDDETVALVKECVNAAALSDSPKLSVRAKRILTITVILIVAAGFTYAGYKLFFEGKTEQQASPVVPAVVAQAVQHTESAELPIIEEVSITEPTDQPVVAAHVETIEIPVAAPAPTIIDELVAPVENLDVFGTTEMPAVVPASEVAPVIPEFTYPIAEESAMHNVAEDHFSPVEVKEHVATPAIVITPADVSSVVEPSVSSVRSDKRTYADVATEGKDQPLRRSTRLARKNYNHR
jgi:hypothetical protein